MFIDTDADEISDVTFGVTSLGSFYQDYWVDIPADRHNTRSCNFTFAEGTPRPGNGRKPRADVRWEATIRLTLIWMTSAAFKDTFAAREGISRAHALVIFSLVLS